MKKTALLAVAFATCLGYVPAQAAEVVSSNIVGYEKIDLTANTYQMSGIQFVGVGGTAASLNDLFTGDIAFGTRIMFLDADTGAYITYRYLEEAYDEAADDFVTGWGDVDEYLAKSPTVNGTGFWFYPVSNTTVTQAGQVDDNDSVTVEVTGGSYVMVANPFPVPFNPNEVTWNSGLEFGTRLMTLSETGAYITYRYLEEAYDEDADDFVTGWGDVDEYLVKAPIAGVGEGFWIFSQNDASITIASPLPNN